MNVFEGCDLKIHHTLSGITILLQEVRLDDDSIMLFYCFFIKL